MADFTQRGIAIVLFSMTVFGTVILAQGGYGVVRRHRERKALEKSGEANAGVSSAAYFSRSLKSLPSVYYCKTEGGNGLETRLAESCVGLGTRL